MAQHDFTISGSSSGATLVSQLNSWEAALLSEHSGSSRPSYAVAGSVWLKNSVTPWEYYMYDGTDDILIGTFNATSNTFTPAGVTSGNYFGTGADGALNITTNTTWDTEDYSGNTISANDTGIVRRDVSSLTISNGAVVTAAYRAQCMVVYCTGDVNITNGTLHMDARGANATASALTFTRSTPSTVLQNEKGSATYTIPAAGASGGATANTTNSVGNVGSAGVNGQTGGGGGGAGSVGGAGAFGNGGAGAAGTAFCGGSGGGAGGNTGSGTAGGAGGANGGAGGNAGAVSSVHAAGGGAGNPVGTGNPGSGSVVAPTGGGGGTLVIVAAGNITVGTGGVIRSRGGAGGNATASSEGGFGGGGAGGGSILLLYGGAYTNNGTVSAPGGAGGTAVGAVVARAGGAGGAGSIVTAQISAT